MAIQSANPNANICFVTSEYPPVVGGVSKSAARVVSYLASAAYKVHVFAPGPETLRHVATTVESAGGGGRCGPEVSVTRFPAPGNPIGLLRHVHHEVARLDQRVRFDLFHGFYMIMAFPFLRIAQRNRRPLIASIRGSDATVCIDDPASVGMVKAVLRQADGVTSVSTDLLDRAAAVYPVMDKATLILNAISTEGVRPWRPHAANQGVIGTVGEFRKKKGTIALIHAYARVPKTLRRQLRLIGYYGTQAYGASCKAAAQDRSVSAEIDCTGRVSQAAVARLLPSLGVYVQPSLDDGLPNALLEAAAAGVPIVATQTGGMSDVLVDGENALVVAPGDRPALAGALERVLADKALALRLSAGARTVAQRCNPAQEKASWLALYDRFLGRGRTLRARDSDPASVRTSAR